MRKLSSAALLALALAFPGAAFAAVSAGQPFPTNRYTTVDLTQATFLRVNLPKPDCTTHPSDCQDIAVLNQLDGFNIQPRISVPFSGPIDLSTVSSSTIFLIGPGLHKVGINQIEWEPAANTLHFESDEQLRPHSTYLLVVTRGVHDADGHPIAGASLGHETDGERAAAPLALAGGGPFGIAALSVFTTQSIDAISAKIRAQLTPTPVSFLLGTGGERTVFPTASVAAIQIKRQVGTAPRSRPRSSRRRSSAAWARSRSARTRHPTTRTRTRSFRRSGRARVRRCRRGRTKSSSASSSRRAPPRRAAGPSRSSATASPTRRTARPSQSPAGSRRTGSRRSRSTSSATAAAPSAPTRCCAGRSRRSSCRTAAAGSTRTGTGRSTRPRASARSARTR